MANEFVTRNGLIIFGATGSTMSNIVLTIDNNGTVKNSLVNDLQIFNSNLGVTASLSSSISSFGDMTTTTSQTVSGVKTFLNGRIGLRNVANTFTSFLTNTNTSSITYTLQNRNGTLADMTDIAGRMATPTGSLNYLSKFLTSSTIGTSRLFDNGTFFGVGTFRTPTKDITLGRQDNRIIGIEQSDSVTNGKDLTIEAGRSINFNESSTFDLFQTPITNRMWNAATDPTTGDVYVVNFGSSGGLFKLSVGGTTFVNVFNLQYSYHWAITFTPNGDLYTFSSGGALTRNQVSTGISLTGGFSLGASLTGDVYGINSTGIYVSIGGTSSFTLIQSGIFNSVAGDSLGDVYAIGSGNLWKQTGGVGLFVNTSVVTFGGFLTITPNGDMYSAVQGGNIYVRVGYSGSFNSLGGATRDWHGLASTLGGSIFGFEDNGGSIYYKDNGGVGIPNLNGGTLNLKAGTGKGTGTSKVRIITGGKTASGTNMQTEFIRMEINELGLVSIFNTPVYSNNLEAIRNGLTGSMIYKDIFNNLKVVNSSNLQYKGTLSLSSPILTNGSGVLGDFYNVIENGTYSFGGATMSLLIDDYVIYNISNQYTLFIDNPSTTSQKTLNNDIILDNSFNNKIVKVKSSSTITIPTGLYENFNCIFDAWDGATASFIVSGVTISSSIGTTLAPGKMATLYKDGNNEVYRLRGELS